MAKYQSPFSLFKALDLEADDLRPEGLKKLKKRLLLELDMAGGLSLDVNGMQLSKQDILSLSDRLQTEADKMPFHKILARQPRFVALLEGKRFIPENEASLDLSEGFYRDLQETEGMRDFLSPYLGPVLIPLIKKSILARDFNRHGIVWLRLGNLLTGEERDAFLDRLSHSINGIAEEINRVENKSVSLDKRSWTFLSGRPFYLYLNQLPEEVSDLRQLIAFAVNDLVVAYQHTELTFCHFIMQGLVALRVDGEIRKLIQDNAGILKENYNKKKGNNDGCFPGVGRVLGGIGLVFVFLRIILLGGTCMDDDDGYRYQPRPQQNVSLHSIHHMGHWSLSNDIRRATRSAWQTMSFDSVFAEYPAGLVYPEYYMAYSDTAMIGQDYPVMVRNYSDYHAIVFVISKWSRLNFVLPAGRQKKIYIPDGAVLTCYAGRKWHKEYPIEIRQKTLVSVSDFAGLFEEVPDNGLEQISWFYPYARENQPNAPGPGELRRLRSMTDKALRDSLEDNYTAAFELHDADSNNVEIRTTPGFTLSKTFLY